MPPQAPQSDQVKAALDELLGWSEVARSPQLAKFLKHIVDAKLRGEEGNIKAYSIAVDVFGRPSTFDPQADPIVRVQARRLRGLLQEFYRQNLGRSTARITLPVGRYVPEFESLATQAVADLPVPEPVAPPLQVPAKPKNPTFGKHFWLQALAATGLVVLLGLVLLGLQYLRMTPAAPAVLPGEPTVLIATFANDTDDPELGLFAGHFSERLGALLAQFEDLRVGYAEQNQNIAATPSTFVLSGSVRSAGSKLEIAAQLTESSDGRVVWRKTFPADRPAGSDDAIVLAAAQAIAREVGPFRGPVHANGRRWMDEQVRPLPGVSGYVCLLAYRYARESPGSPKIAEALACNERLLAETPDAPLALAAEAWLQNATLVNDDARPGDDMTVLLAAPLALAERARDLAPESSFVYEQLGVVQHWQGKFGAAQQSFAIALGFQALNSDARAAYAVSLFRSGDWQQGALQAKQAVADALAPAPWYYYPLALAALHEGRLAEALHDAKIAATSGAREIGAVIALAVAGHLGDTAAITEYAPVVLNSERIRRMGVIPWLKIRASDDQSLNQIAEGLKIAGIPESALTGPF